jgi:hypothetical protein
MFLLKILIFLNYFLKNRREGYSKITTLKERNSKEERKFISELRESFRVIDHHDKLRGFMLQKVNSRSQIRNQIQEYFNKCIIIFVSIELELFLFALRQPRNERKSV